MFFRMLVLVALIGLPSIVMGQGVPTLTGLYKEAVKGQILTFTFDYSGDRSIVKYFRVRKSQTYAGAFLHFARISPTESGFEITATSSCHVFISTVWDETQPDGSTVTRESPGSNHVQIIVK